MDVREIVSWICAIVMAVCAIIQTCRFESLYLKKKVNTQKINSRGNSGVISQKIKSITK